MSGAKIAARIIYGTAWKQERTTGLVVQAVQSGFRAIDTACQPKHYREDLVGKALLELDSKHGIKREDLWIQTKYTPIGGQDTTKPLPYKPTDPVSLQIQTSFKKSLSNLHTTYLDSYILHSPLKSLELTLEAWRELIKLQDAGKVKMIGVSNTYDVNLLHALGKERKVQVVQNRWYEGNQWDREVIQYCRENDILYQSFWTLSGSPTLLKNQALLAIADSTKGTPQQALFKIAQLEGVVPLSGTTSLIHMKEDLAVEDLAIPDDCHVHVSFVKDLLHGRI